MTQDLQSAWQVMTSLARYGPRGRGRLCESIRRTRTGRAVLWSAWLLIAVTSSHTMFTVMAIQRRDLLVQAIEV